MPDRYYKAKRLTLQPVPGVGIVVINKGETGRLPQDIGDRLVGRGRVSDDGAASDKETRTGLEARRKQRAQRNWRDRSTENERPVKGVEKAEAPKRSASKRRRKPAAKKGTSTRSRAGATETRKVIRTPAKPAGTQLSNGTGPTPAPAPTPTVATDAPTE